MGTKEVRQPDLVAIRKDRLHIITKRGIEGPPDLVAEIVSPHSAKRDREQKLEAYAWFGISEYWIVTFTRELQTLEQYVLAADGRYGAPHVYVEDEEIVSQVMPCARFSMNDIARRVPELPNG